MNRAQTVLAIINVTGFIVITILAMLSVKYGSEWGMEMLKNILPLLIGCWISNVTTVINYIFGTSASSQRKSEILDRMTVK